MVVTARPTTPEETAALAAEAEFVYREVRRLIDTFDRRGGATTLPTEFEAYVDGLYAAAVEEGLKITHDQGQRIEGTTMVTRMGVISTDDLRPESLLGVQFCDDRSKLTHVSKTGVRTPLKTRFENVAEFTRGSDGKLKMVYNISKPVDSCDV